MVWRVYEAEVGSGARAEQGAEQGLGVTESGVGLSRPVCGESWGRLWLVGIWLQQPPTSGVQRGTRPSESRQPGQCPRGVRGTSLSGRDRPSLLSLQLRGGTGTRGPALRAEPQASGALCRAQEAPAKGQAARGWGISPQP